MNICLNFKMCIKRLLWLFVALVIFGLIVIIREPDHALRKSLSRWPFLSWLIQERDKTYLNAKYIELSERMPSLEYLVKFMFGVDRAHPESLRDYLPYYQLIINYFPDTSEAYGMLGYCYFYLGEINKSEEMFFKARALNKDYFWYSFNLGIIHAKLNHIKEADLYFQEAREMDAGLFQKTLNLLAHSSIFQQIFSRVDGLNGEYFKNDLQNAYQFIRERRRGESAEIQLRLF